MVDGPTQVTWCPLCRRGEYCPDNERLMKQNTEINADLLAALKALLEDYSRCTYMDGWCPRHNVVDTGAPCKVEAARAAIKRAEGK